jgi:hypothetical protein
VCATHGTEEVVPREEWGSVSRGSEKESTRDANGVREVGVCALCALWGGGEERVRDANGVA